MERGKEEATAPRLQPCPQLPPNLGQFNPLAAGAAYIRVFIFY